MKHLLHITSGDSSGKNLKESGIPGEVLVWRDILYDGPRKPGWPAEAALRARARFLEETTGGGLHRQEILEMLRAQYLKLEAAGDYDGLILWFDACLFDQAMLVHILACMKFKGITAAKLICVDAFPGIEPFNGLGQLHPGQLASVYGRRRAVSSEQLSFAEVVDRAFALQDESALAELANCREAPLPWIPAAAARWLQERPDEATGLGRLEQLALAAVQSGCRTPAEVFASASAHDTPPQFWGDTTLWARINGMATRRPPLVRIEGPFPLLPQWGEQETIEAFRLYPMPAD